MLLRRRCFQRPQHLLRQLPDPANRWGEQDDAASTTSGAQITMGTLALSSITGSLNSANDADMYLIQICDPNNFSADTTAGPGTVSDSQLFLFSLTGIGRKFNDDLPAGATNLSRLTNSFLAGAGSYILAVSSYDVDPMDSQAREIWLDQPYTTERAPDGPGANFPVNFWAGSGDSGTYTIALTGTCFAAPLGWAEQGDAGDQIIAAQAPAGAGPLGAISGTLSSNTDSDIYRIILCDPASFSAETASLRGSLDDSQLFLFHPSGIGIAANDDEPIAGSHKSRLGNAFTSSLASGAYYLGISGYNRDPQNNAGQLLWLDTPNTTERAPDGPGAASTLASWGTTTGGVGSYIIRLGGVCYSNNCYANCDGSTVQPVLNANDFACFLNKFAAGCS